MKYFELSAEDISALNDGDLRELIGRLCEAELIQHGLSTSSVTWGGAQEAADGGLDVSVNEKNELSSPNFIPKNITGYQVKKHSMGKSACTKEMQEKGAVKPIVAELANRNGAYIIVSGKDDCSDKMLSDRLDGMKAAVASLANKDDLKLDFYGRDRIVTWLRQYPGVSLWARHQLGKPLSGWQPFGRWAATPLDMADEFLSDKHPCVFVANIPSKDPQPILDGIKLVREKLIDGERALRITGLSGVGKTRFVQALFEDGVGEHPLPRANAIYADLGDDLSPSASELVAHLIANDSAAYLVLDNCPPEAHRQLQRKVASSATKLRLLTIEYDISDDKPEETEVIHLEPVSEETVSKLVQLRFPELGRVNSNKIAEFSGGNARVAIALASRVEGDETLATLSDEDLFQKLFIQRKGANDSLLESAEVLSLVYSFNVSQVDFNDELAALGRVSGIERRTLYKKHAELLRRQIAQKRGEWRAVLPHALANRLARRALENLTACEINAELFKEDNLRLFKSCAHRIGYLHDSEAAKTLVKSWIAVDAPLHDVSNCGADQLICLGYIAPVFPEAILSALEKAGNQPGFATCSNPNFNIVTQLLCQLAYEDSLFDQAIALLLKFAETEQKGDNNDRVVGQMKNLFSLYLSGTEALPRRRHVFVGRLFQSPNPRHREIAVELFNSALESSHWSTSALFGFGARRRGVGWQPMTSDEQLEWYAGFIKLLKDGIQSNDEDRAELAKDIIASNFRSLWSFADCFDLLEEIVRGHALDGNWPELWMAIKNTIHFDGNRHAASMLMRLKELEVVSAPNDPYAEIKAYALSNTWDHAEVKGANYSEAVQSINEKILRLGSLASSEPEYLVRLGENIWEKHIDALWTFGKGLARGSQDKMETFEFLLELADKLAIEKIQPVLMQGFVNEVQIESPGLARRMYERFLQERKFKEHFVYLLCAIPLEAWGVLKLIELAAAGELDAWKFVQISHGRVHERISDDDLAKLLEAILELNGGVPAVLQILDMRFHIDKGGDYIPSEFVLTVGRKAIKRMSIMHRDEFLPFRSYGYENIANFCLSPAAPKREISEITAKICEGVETLRLYSFELGDLISPLIRNFPEIVLDNVFIGDKRESLRIHLLFRESSSGLRETSLNEAPIDRLLAWCGRDQRKILTVGKALRAYSPVNASESQIDNLRKVSLSDHIKAFLDAADDKAEMINVIVSSAWPSSWSGSRADILEARAQAFSELLNHSSDEVCSLAASKLQLIENSVRENRLRETDEESEREQRFE